MTNLFQSISNNFKEEKKKRKEKEERYWKLPATERLHYDSIINKLNREKGLNFGVTGALFVITLFIFFIIFLTAYSIDYPITKLIELLKPVSLRFIKVLFLALCLDLVFSSILTLRINKEINKINKRFKL